MSISHSTPSGVIVPWMNVIMKYTQKTFCLSSIIPRWWRLMLISECYRLVLFQDVIHVPIYSDGNMNDLPWVGLKLNSR